MTAPAPSLLLPRPTVVDLRGRAQQAKTGFSHSEVSVLALSLCKQRRRNLTAHSIPANAPIPYTALVY